MSARRQHGYHFASAAQWEACLFIGADRINLDEGTAIHPFAAFRVPTSPTFSSSGARAPARTREREVLWRDDTGMLHRLSHGDDEPQVVAAPAAIAQGSRLIATVSGLWAVGGTQGTVECFALETLSRRFVVALGESRVIDIAADGRDGIFALIARGNAWYVMHVDCAGTIGTRIALEGISEPGAFTYVYGAGRIVVLSQDGKRIFVFPATGGLPLTRILAASLVPCFVGCCIASDPRHRVFIAGADEANTSRASVVVLDAGGVQLDHIALPEPATGLGASRDGLLVTSTSGLYVLPLADPVPDAVREMRAIVVTPMLESPDTEDGRRWLRIEAAASLPAGSSLEITYAATDDAAERDAMLKIASDPSMPAAKRAQVLRTMDLWSSPMTFHGAGASTPEDHAPFTVPLHDVRGRYLWVTVSLAASAGSSLPVLTRLSVLYRGQTLMDHLPVIYQRDAAEPGSFTRALVGVLETTTQDLDARIAEMSRLIHPEHAPAPWLDYVARWLGLPWDDALDLEQKRCILRSAPRLARARGTRVGLEALLDCVMVGKPGRFRVVDGTVDHGLARLGGRECHGAALPAILGGLPATAARLGVQATLGAMRLSCGDDQENDATSRFLGRVRIDLAASGHERKRWQPWLSRLVTEMMPVGTRARVSWTTTSRLRGDRLDDSFTLDADHPPRLDTDAITGAARLPRASSTLPAMGAGEGPTLE